jgi:GNAT superfamily N-acetyltransferase
LTIILTTFSGIIMSYLATIRVLTRGYVTHAEKLKYSWLDDTTVIVTKFGEEIIGTVVLGWEKGEKGSRRKKSGRGVIRAWTVRLKYRHKGIGRALLEETVKVVGEKGGDGVGFAEDHASKSPCLLSSSFRFYFDENVWR